MYSVEVIIIPYTIHNIIILYYSSMTVAALPIKGSNWNSLYFPSPADFGQDSKVSWKVRCCRL